MITLPVALAAAFNAASNRPVDLYELYLDSGTLYLSTITVTWGGHTYQPWVLGRSTIERIEGPEFDTVSVRLDNTSTAAAAALLAEEIEGRKLIIRKIDTTVAGESLVLFTGRMSRLGRVDETSVELEAQELIASIGHDVPSRIFHTRCGWKFKGSECGYAGVASECNKSWARCTELANTPRFGGFRFIPHAGAFSYTETQQQRFLLLFSRKKSRQVTVDFAAQDHTTTGAALPIVLGRAQLAALPIQHVDEGDATKVLAALAVGTVYQIDWVRANEVAAADWTPHLGQLGGTGSQLVDSRFPGGQAYNLVAYVGVTVPSDVRTVDPAPTIRALVLGSQVDFFDAAGAYTGFGWTDSPAWNLRHLLVLANAQGGCGIDPADIDNAAAWRAAQYWAELISDTTGDQVIFLPATMPANVRVGVDYRRYRSTGVSGGDPAVDGPYTAYEPGVNDDTTAAAAVMVKRCTLNTAIARPQRAMDLVWSLLRQVRGFLRYGQDGKLQICAEQPVANTTLSGAVAAGVTVLNVASSTPFAVGDRVLIGALTAAAEVRTVSAVGAGTLTVSAVTASAHASGVVVHLVHMVLDDALMLGKVAYPAERGDSVNRITIKYIDAAAGFEETTLIVDDEAHQEKVRKVNNREINGSAIDSYFQAWRVAQFELAKARDLGKFVSCRTDIKGSVLEIGDVVAVTAVECGLSAAPFRVVRVSFDENDEVEIVGQVYDQGVYSDVAPRATARVPSVFASPAAVAPAPEVWLPYAEQPAVGDPLLAREDWQMAALVDYEVQEDGRSAASLRVIGDAPVVSFEDGVGPVLSGAVVASTGGALVGGKSYFVRVHAQRSDGRLSLASNTLRVTVPAGTSTNRITVSASWPGGSWANYVLLASDDVEVMAVQTTGALAATVAVAGPLKRATWGVPLAGVRSLRLRLSRAPHLGVAGAEVTALSSTTITCSSLADVAAIDNWTGRVVSVPVDASDGSAAVWNFAVSAFNVATGQMTVSPDPVAAGVQVGDVLIVDAQATAVGASSITDGGFSNKFSRPGLSSAEEEGRLVMMLSGAARGQRRRILSVSSGIAFTLDRPWTVMPAVGDKFAIIEAASTVAAEVSLAGIEVPGQQVEMRCGLDNRQGQGYWAQVMFVDGNGLESAVEKSPGRFVYVFGDEGTAPATLIIPGYAS